MEALLFFNGNNSLCFEEFGIRPRHSSTARRDDHG
jgi:hypothetical protein